VVLAVCHSQRWSWQRTVGNKVDADSMLPSSPPDARSRLLSAHHTDGGPVPAADVLAVQGLPRGSVSRLFCLLSRPPGSARRRYTVKECVHTFCKSCIVKFLHVNPKASTFCASVVLLVLTRCLPVSQVHVSNRYVARCPYLIRFVSVRLSSNPFEQLGPDSETFCLVCNCDDMLQQERCRV
jgi:hypothetical protein